MHGWTAVMCAICHRNFESVQFLVSKGANLHIENRKGETAFHLAERKRWTSTLQGIIASHEVKNEPGTSKEEVIVLSDDEEEDFAGYCEICKIETDKMRFHCKSIGHQMVKPHKFPTVGSFALGPKHVGYKMMQKSGWTGDTGLGAQESGRLYPVKASMKQDRLGIGMKKKDLPKQTINVQTRFLSTSQLKKQRQRERQLEKKMREDFNHDFTLP